MIYFLQRGDECIKIGKTHNYPRRFAQLTAIYGDLVLLGVMDGYTDAEKSIHRHFQNQRIWGTEFFTPSAELTTFIHEYTHMDYESLQMTDKNDKVMRSYRLPSDLLRRVRIAAQYNGVSDTSVITMGLHEFLGKVEREIKQWRDSDED